MTPPSLSISICKTGGVMPTSQSSREDEMRKAEVEPQAEALGSGALSCSPPNRGKQTPPLGLQGCHITNCTGRGRCKSAGEPALGQPGGCSPSWVALPLREADVKGAGSGRATTEPIHSPDNLFHVSDKMGSKSETRLQKRMSGEVLSFLQSL